MQAAPEEPSRQQQRAALAVMLCRNPYTPAELYPELLVLMDAAQLHQAAGARAQLRDALTILVALPDDNSLLMFGGRQLAGRLARQHRDLVGGYEADAAVLHVLQVVWGRPRGRVLVAATLCAASASSPVRDLCESFTLDRTELLWLQPSAVILVVCAVSDLLAQAYASYLFGLVDALECTPGEICAEAWTAIAKLAAQSVPGRQALVAEHLQVHAQQRHHPSSPYLCQQVRRGTSDAS